MQLKSLGNLSIATEIIKANPNDFNVISSAIKNLSNEYKATALASSMLSDAQKLQILISQGLTAEEAKQAIALNALSASETKATGTTGGLSTAFKGLAASLGISTAALGALVAGVAAFGVAAIAINKYKQYLEEIRQATEEAAHAYKESSSSIDDYVAKYIELREALIKAKGNEEETYNIKKQLLDLQTELNDKFGDEYGQLNLVTDAYKDQTDALKEYNQEVAKTYLNENQKGIKNATKEMTAERQYNLGSAINLDSNDKWMSLREVALQYKDKGIDLANDQNGTLYVQLTADAESAYEIINEFESDLREKAKELGDEHLFDSVLDISSSELNRAKETIDKYGEIYKQALMANMVSDDGKSEIYNKALDAVEKYNEAVLKSEDPFTDEKVKNARQALKDIQDEINGDDSWEKYGAIVEEVFEQVNTKLIDFNEKLQSDSGLQKLANNLKDLDNVDLKSLNPNENASFDKLKESADEYGLSVDELIDSLVRLDYVQGEIQNSALTDALETEISFTIEEYEEQIDNVQSTISSLRSALDSFNKGTLDESAVLDLMQQFPALIPYIDLAADGFGNLSEGLSVLIAQQPDSLIQSLQTLKESLNTDEERAQVDALINSLQSLSSYGDTGMEAYATSIGSTWTDTANVIQSVTDQFENLAKVQEAVADGLTISTSAAAELAKMYPEILTNAEYAGNGQIQLNEEVVKSILAGDQSIINAQITKLEADKAELEAKKSYAEAQLEMIKQVAEGEGNITKEVAQYRLDIANALLQALIEAGMEEDKAYAAVAANMAGNMDEYNRIVGEVAKDTSVNMDNAAVSMANSININAINAQNSFKAMQQSVWSLADSIRAAASGERAGSTINPSGGGSTSGKNIVTDIHSGNFGTTLTEYTPKSIDFSDFQSQLKIDISAYEKAISNIDSQIEVLKNLQGTFADSVNSANGGIGGHNYADKIKDIEAEKNKINSSLNDAKSGSGSSKETKDEYEELFDFFERRVKVLDNALSLLKTNLDNVTGSFAKNKLIDAELGVTEEKFKNYSDALNMYTQKANEALSKLPSDIAAKVKDGAVDLTTFIGDGNKEVVEAIKDYEQWADKVADCKQELAELRTAIRQLELEKFNNIMEEFSNQFDLREDGKDLISKQIDLLKEAGQLIGESFFTTQIDQSKKQLALLEAEKTKLVEQMTSAVSSGRVQKGTTEWLSMVNSLSGVESEILDCKKALEELDNSILSLHTEIFERIQNQFSDLDSEISNIIGLFDDFEVSDDKGIWSKEAIAQLGLLSQQYELAQHRVQQYNDEIDELNAQYLAGKFSATEYADRLATLNSEQWNCVKSSESALSSIMDLNEARVNNAVKGIEKEVSAYKELIDAQIDALKAEKD